MEVKIDKGDDLHIEVAEYGLSLDITSMHRKDLVAIYPWQECALVSYNEFGIDYTCLFVSYNSEEIDEMICDTNATVLWKSY